MTQYDPGAGIPPLTTQAERRLLARLEELPAFDQLNDDLATRFERHIIEAVLAAAITNPLATVGEAWGVVSFREWRRRGAPGAETAFMEAANRVIRLMADEPTDS